MIEVTRAGFYTSVQDLGRHRYRHLGVGLSVAMDTRALSIANYLVGNTADRAGLEITMGQASFTFRADAEIALAGATLDASLDGRPLQNWSSRQVKAGQTLRLLTFREGVRSYLAVRGGIDVPVVLGSAATDLKGGFGGLDGRTLRSGDVLAIGPAVLPTRFNTGLGLSRRLLPQDTVPATVHLLPSAQWNHLTAEAQRRLLDALWHVSPQSNRVGCRLDGPVLARRVQYEMRSHGIMPGVVQLPPNGQPIVQLCDGNTSGGYPVIATVIRADLDLFAQLRPRDGVKFVLCALAEARAHWVQRQRYLDDIAERCALMRRQFN